MVIRPAPMDLGSYLYFADVAKFLASHRCADCLPRVALQSVLSFFPRPTERAMPLLQLGPLAGDWPRRRDGRGHPVARPRRTVHLLS